MESEKDIEPKIVLEIDEAGAERKWGGHIEFILTCVGYAVGLGNVWRFPYLTYDSGGGAFLIPYVLMLVFVGLPLFFLELSIGQFASLGPTKIWDKLNPLVKGVGYCGITVSWYITLYFCVVIAWMEFFLFSSFQDPLPWTDCENDWNVEPCVDGKDNSTGETAAHQFFYNHVLDMSDGIFDTGVVKWDLMLLLLLNWIIVFLVILKGVASLGKVSYVTSLLPYLFMTIMLVRGCMLDGAGKGIEFYLKPEFDRITDLKVWADAATQIFFSLGVGMGSLIAMASYNEFNNNVLRDSLLVPFINCGTSIYTGFVVFAFLGFMANERNVDVDEVAAEGPGLIFVVYPEGLAQMPAAPVWSVCFFIMMCLIGFSSVFSIAEGFCTTLTDEFPNFLTGGRRPLILRATYCITGFLLGLPMVTKAGFYWFTILNGFGTGYPLLLVGLIEVVFIGYIYGYKFFADDIEMMLGRKPPLYYKVCWLVLSPIFIMVTIGFTIARQSTPVVLDYQFPPWGTAMAWFMASFPMMWVLVFFFYNYCRMGGFKVLKEGSRPRDEWGPSSSSNRTGRYAKDTEDTNGGPFTIPRSSLVTGNENPAFTF